MDRSPEHERPTKRAKRADAGNVPTPSPNSRQIEEHDVEEPDSVLDNNAAQGSDLYLDTV